MNGDQNSAPLPLTVAKLDIHLEQRIQERLNMGHLYTIEEVEGGWLDACCTDRAAASVWRVVQDAVHEAGWKIVI